MADIGSPRGSSPLRDKRKSARKRSFLRGKIAFDDGARCFDCIIRDISDAGARIDLAAGHIVPKHLVLIDMRNGNAHEGEVKWRTASQLGMGFVRSFSLERPLSPEDRYLKHLWAGSLRVIDAGSPSGRLPSRRK